MPTLSLEHKPPAPTSRLPAERRRRQYSGAALERRRAWGRAWGQRLRDAARTLKEGSE